MASAFATYLNDKGRLLLWRAHSEALVIRIDGITASAITGVWKRVEPDGTQSPDGQGLIGYTGQAKVAIKKDDLPDVSSLAKAEIDREGETWAVRHAESQDQWTWILHLSRRKPGNRYPTKP